MLLESMSLSCQTSKWACFMHRKKLWVCGKLVSLQAPICFTMFCPWVQMIILIYTSILCVYHQPPANTGTLILFHLLSSQVDMLHHQHSNRQKLFHPIWLDVTFSYLSYTNKLSCTQYNHHNDTIYTSKDNYVPKCVHKLNVSVNMLSSVSVPLI